MRWWWCDDGGVATRSSPPCVFSSPHHPSPSKVQQYCKILLILFFRWCGKSVISVCTCSSFSGFASGWCFFPHSDVFFPFAIVHAISLFQKWSRFVIIIVVYICYYLTHNLLIDNLKKLSNDLYLSIYNTLGTNFCTSQVHQLIHLHETAIDHVWYEWFMIICFWHLYPP